ncbi:MAG: hypothetical protein VKK03_06995 [Synechococcus sp.]|nr:hypothetical protein [Synechococcus sp.]
MKRPVRLLPWSLALSGLAFAVPMAGLPMGELHALNRELGRLCRRPPREAVAVCRIHARLVQAL